MNFPAKRTFTVRFAAYTFLTHAVYPYIPKSPD